MYLSYLFVFIDSWNSGVISAAWQGWLGLPYAFREHRWGGMLVGIRSHPIPFWEGELGKRNHISACREDILCLASSCRTSKPPPPPQALHSLPCPYVFIGPASWCFSVWLMLYLMLPISGDGDKSKDMWVSLRRKDKIRYSAVVWRKSEGREDESWFCRVP